MSWFARILRSLTSTGILRRAGPRSWYFHLGLLKWVYYLLRSIWSNWLSTCANRNNGVAPEKKDPKRLSPHLRILRKLFLNARTRISRGYSFPPGSNSTGLLLSWQRWCWHFGWRPPQTLCLNEERSTSRFVDKVARFGDDLADILRELVGVINLHHCVIIYYISIFISGSKSFLKDKEEIDQFYSVCFRFPFSIFNRGAHPRFPDTCLEPKINLF